MDFNETIKKVNFFYADYDKTMANVDNYFDIIDTNAGQESSNELKIIIDILKNFWNKYSNNESVNQELIVDEELSSFSNKLGEPFENETVIFDLCKKIQAYFRNYTAVDTKPIIHCESGDVINRLFEHIENNEFHNKDLQFTITRIIYELVSDDLLIRCGISKLHKWNYGTDAYSLLSSEQQLVILLNQSIMIDRLHSGQHLLKLYLKRLNKQIDGFHYLDWFVYYVAGFLNFKIHNYRESKKYFERVEKESKLHNSTSQTKKRYFHAVLLIAYGHEYAGEFAQAIEKIVMPVNDLLALLNSIEVINIKQTSVLLTVLNNLVTKAYKDTLFSKFFSGTTITEHISDTDEQDQRDIHIEILHALAHCINEYAIQNYNTKAEDCAKLIRFARALMAFIAKEVKEYWTCYATIHGEYKDYDFALEELSKASLEITKKEGKIKESLEAEIAFYQYYFGQIIHKNVDKEKEQFSKYCQKYSDDDALCHLKIFEFSALLREHISKMFNFLTRNSRKNGGIEELPSIDTIRKAYNAICQLHPSSHMNINIRTELRLMQRIYTIIEYLNCYLINPSRYNTIMLENACKRFCYTKKEMGLATEVSYPKYKSTQSILPPKIHQTLFGEYGVVHCLNTTDSIFLLAPISGVVVYQYQTGTIDRLFDNDSLLGLSIIHKKNSYRYSQIKDTITAYRNVVSEDKQVQISNVDMQIFSRKGIDNIYLWSSDSPLRLLQTNQMGSYSRRLIDGNLFRNTIDGAVNRSIEDYRLCIKNDENDCYCKIHTVKLPWTEIINEETCDNYFLLHKRVRDNTIEYLILSGNCSFLDDQCCEIHTLLDNVKVRQLLHRDNHPPLPRVTDSIQLDNLKIKTKNNYSKLKTTCKLLKEKEEFLPNYIGTNKELECQKDIEELKNKKFLLIQTIEAEIKELSNSLSESEYLKFVKQEIDFKDWNVFSIK